MVSDPQFLLFTINDSVISIVRNADTKHVTRSDLSWESPAYHTACNKSNTTGATCGTGNVYTSGVHSSCAMFSWVPVAGSLVFCVLFCSSLFVLLPPFFLPLWCLFFFNLRLLITLLASSSFSSNFVIHYNFLFCEVEGKVPNIVSVPTLFLLCDVWHNC